MSLAKRNGGCLGQMSGGMCRMFGYLRCVLGFERADEGGNLAPQFCMLLMLSLSFGYSLGTLLRGVIVKEYILYWNMLAGMLGLLGLSGAILAIKLSPKIGYRRTLLLGSVVSTVSFLLCVMPVVSNLPLLTRAISAVGLGIISYSLMGHLAVGIDDDKTFLFFFFRFFVVFVGFLVSKCVEANFDEGGLFDLVNIMGFGLSVLSSLLLIVCGSGYSGAENASEHDSYELTKVLDSDSAFGAITLLFAYLFMSQMSGINFWNVMLRNEDMLNDCPSFGKAISGVLAVIFIVLGALSVRLRKLIGIKMLTIVGVVIMCFSSVMCSFMVQEECGRELIPLMIIYFVGYSISAGPMTWMVLTESFQGKVLKSGVKMAVFMDWVGYMMSTSVILSLRTIFDFHVSLYPSIFVTTAFCLYLILFVDSEYPEAVIDEAPVASNENKS